MARYSGSRQQLNAILVPEVQPLFVLPGDVSTPVFLWISVQWIERRPHDKTAPGKIKQRRFRAENSHLSDG